jgi:hypothetical protein
MNIEGAAGMAADAKCFLMFGYNGDTWLKNDHYV